MPAGLPPRGHRIVPNTRVLPAGTILWRAHRTRHPAVSFNPELADEFFGGFRFDGVEDVDPYPSYYAAFEPTTALAEVLLRDRPYQDGIAVRVITHEEVADRTLSAVETVAETLLISLVTEEDLAAVCQDGWLLEADGPQYAQTRRWARILREHAGRAQGLVWGSRRHRPREALVFFGDRCGLEPLKPAGLDPCDLSTRAGVDRANAWLAPLRSVIIPPTDLR